MNDNKELLLQIIHKIFRKDPYIMELFGGTGKTLDELKNKLTLIKKEFLFSTMTIDKVIELEKELDYKTSSKTLEGKRAEIEARWKMSGKSDLELLQTISDAWKAKATKLAFNDGVIEVDFLGGINADYDITGLRKALEEAKPAHLPLLFTMTEQQQTSLKYGGAIEEALTIEIKEQTTDQALTAGITRVGVVLEVAERYEL